MMNTLGEAINDFFNKDNFARTVKETQIRLWAYRRIVHKRFCDQIVLYARYHFPSSLLAFKDKVMNIFLSSDSSSSESGVESIFILMKEPHGQSKRREELVSSITRITEGLQVIKKASIPSEF